MLNHGSLRTAVPAAIASAALLTATASAQTPIATGGNSADDGYLEVNTDEYGSWSQFNPAPADRFNPLDHDLIAPGFSSGFFLFVPSQSQRELLSDDAGWQSSVGGDASLDRAVVSPNSASDTTGNGVDDTVTSAFRVFGGSTDLHFDVVQQVRSVGMFGARLSQEYTIRNDGASSISFLLVRHYDPDLTWQNGITDDEVGTSSNAVGSGASVFVQETGSRGPTTIELASPSAAATSYYGYKSGIEPPGGPPTPAAGSTNDLWDSYGIPASWQDFITNVGVATDGLSGSGPGTDVGMGLGFEIQLEPNGTITIPVTHDYGVCVDLTVTGSGRATTELEFLLRTGVPHEIAILALSPKPGWTVHNLGPFGTLELNLSRPIIFHPLGRTDANGDAGLNIIVPNIPEFSMNAQGFTRVFDSGRGSPRWEFCVSDAVPFQIGGPPPVGITVECNGSNSFNSNTSSGFFSVTNANPDPRKSIVKLTFDWEDSSNAGQSTMVFDCDQTGMADAFWYGRDAASNSGCGMSGTYRNGSDTAAGLIYDPAITGVTHLTAPCSTDPTENSGAEPELMTVNNSFRTLHWRFTPDTFYNGVTLEMDVDTDGGVGIGGDDMAGMVVTIELRDGSIVQGEIQAVASDLGRLEL